MLHSKFPFPSAYESTGAMNRPTNAVMTNIGLNHEHESGKPVKKETGTYMTLGDRPGLPACYTPPVEPPAQSNPRRRRRPARLRARSQGNQPPLPNTSEESYGRLVKKDSLEIHRRLIAQKAATKQLLLLSTSTEDVRGQAPSDAKYTESSSCNEPNKFDTSLQRGTTSFDQLTFEESFRDNCLQSSMSNGDSITSIGKQGLFAHSQFNGKIGQGDAADPRHLAIHPSVAALLPPQVTAALINDRHRQSAVQRKLQELTELVITTTGRAENHLSDKLWENMANLRLQDAQAQIWGARKMSGGEQTVPRPTTSTSITNAVAASKPTSPIETSRANTTTGMHTISSPCAPPMDTFQLPNNGHGQFNHPILKSTGSEHVDKVGGQNNLAQSIMSQSQYNQAVYDHFAPQRLLNRCECIEQLQRAQMTSPPKSSCFGTCGDPMHVPDASQSSCQLPSGPQECLTSQMRKHAAPSHMNHFGNNPQRGMIVGDQHCHRMIPMMSTDRSVGSEVCHSLQGSYSSSPESRTAQKTPGPKKIRTSADAWQLTLTCTGLKKKELRRQVCEDGFRGSQPNCRLPQCTHLGITSPGPAPQITSGICTASCCSVGHHNMVKCMPPMGAQAFSCSNQVTHGIEVPHCMRTGHVQEATNGSPLISGGRFLAGSDGPIVMVTEPVIPCTDPAVPPTPGPICQELCDKIGSNGTKQKRVLRKMSCPEKPLKSRPHRVRHHSSGGGYTMPRYMAPRLPHEAFYGSMMYPHPAVGQPYLMYHTREASITSEVTSGDSIISVKQVDAVYRCQNSPGPDPALHPCDPLNLASQCCSRDKNCQSSKMKVHKHHNRHHSQGNTQYAQRTSGKDLAISPSPTGVHSSREISPQRPHKSRRRRQYHNRSSAPVPWGSSHGNMAPTCSPMMQPMGHHPAYMHPPMLPFLPYHGYQYPTYPQQCSCLACQHACCGDNPMIHGVYGRQRRRYSSNSSQSTSNDRDSFSEGSDTDASSLRDQERPLSGGRSKSRTNRRRRDSEKDLENSPGRHRSRSRREPSPCAIQHLEMEDQVGTKGGYVCGDEPRTSESPTRLEQPATEQPTSEINSRNIEELQENENLLEADVAREVGGHVPTDDEREEANLPTTTGPQEEQHQGLEPEQTTTSASAGSDGVTHQLYQLPGTRTDVVEVFEEREGQLEAESDIVVEDDTQDVAETSVKVEEQDVTTLKCEGASQEVIPESVQNELLPCEKPKLPQPLRQMAYALKYFPKRPADFEAIASALGIDCLQVTDCVYSSLLSGTVLTKKGEKESVEENDDSGASWDKLVKFWLPSRKSLDSFEEIPFPGEEKVLDFDFIHAVTDSSLAEGRPVKVEADQSRTVMRQGDLIVDTRDTNRYFYVTAYSRGSGGKLIKSDVIVDKQTRAMRVDSNVKTRHYMS